MNIDIRLCDALELIKTFDDNSIDLIFTDPPYALGNQVIINSEGKPDYINKKDFMNKWEMPNGKFWEEFFIECFRVLKFGGRVLMYGIDRQLFLFKYYGAFSGLNETQSLYWYYLINFPKSTDLSIKLDKYFGAEREVIGQHENRRTKVEYNINCYHSKYRPDGTINGNDISLPSTDISKKYDGYKYSISPLKQCCNTIMVFQKPYKTGSCLHDVIALENGDNTITCGALNIDVNRVVSDSWIRSNDNMGRTSHSQEYNGHDNTQGHINGRYPAQAFIDDGTAEILDEQSGLISGRSVDIKYRSVTYHPEKNFPSAFINFKKTGPSLRRDYPDKNIGCSRILHTCKYEEGEFDIFNYNSVESPSGRNMGLNDEFELKSKFETCRRDGGDSILHNNRRTGDIVLNRNPHPTVKPFSLNKKILSLFKTPNNQKIFIPFAGSGSEIIGAIQADYTDIIACEINPEYYVICNARVEYFKELELMKSVEEESINYQYSLF